MRTRVYRLHFQGRGAVLTSTFVLNIYPLSIEGTWLYVLTRDNGVNRRTLEPEADGPTMGKRGITKEPNWPCSQRRQNLRLKMELADRARNRDSGATSRREKQSNTLFRVSTYS